MATHPLKAAVELAVFANEYGVDRCLHVVVDAARARPLEEGKGAVMGVEHHLLGLARIGAHEEHAAVAQSDMRHLDGDGRAVDQHNLVRPIELVRLAGRKAQRYIGFRHRGAALGTPLPGVSANRLDRLVLGEIRPTDLCDRLHYQHPLPGPRIPNGSHCGPAVPGVPIGCRSPRKRGPYSTPIHMPEAAVRNIDLWTD